MTGAMRPLRDRLATARLNATRFPPDPRAWAGREAEYDVAFTLQRRLGGTAWRVWHGVRVPGPRGRREIDFVVTTGDHAVVVELKSWVGSIDVDDAGRVVQARRPPKPPVDHGPVFRDLAHKVDLLAALQAERGRPPVELQPLVVFHDHRLRMAAAVRQRADVTTWAQLQEELPGRAGAGPVSPEVLALQATLDELGGWDTLSLYGGRTIFGDLRACPVGEWSRDARVEVRAGRSRLAALFAEPAFEVVCVGRDGVKRKTQADPDAVVEFRPVGRRKTESYQLRHVVAISGGAPAPRR